MINAIIGKKQSQSQRFLEDGTRIPVTEVYVPATPVVLIKNIDKDGYIALQLAHGTKKHPSKALLGHIRGANIKVAPRFLREVRLDSDSDLETLPKVGDILKASDVLKPGDIVDVVGVSKGKGYAGVVKRHHFKGGPRTHGQSDRERAPGSIGQTTTPGRVYKGKRMAGRMGQERVSVRNLKIVDVLDEKVVVKGLIPGSVNSLVMITKMGEDKKFVPLYKEAKIEETASNAADAKGAKEDQSDKVEKVDEVEKAGEGKENIK
ncbi:MAG: 50S ribosomal protein L3 [Candidatus Levybacteria bacterium]|nr:50S ribosomal protein L3 [Candidatus Levybacteria bacterium]